MRIVVRKSIVEKLLAAEKDNKQYSAGDRVIIKLTKGLHYLSTIDKITNNKIHYVRDDGKKDVLPLSTSRIVGPAVSRKRKTAFKEAETKKYLTKTKKPIETVKETKKPPKPKSKSPDTSEKSGKYSAGDRVVLKLTKGRHYLGTVDKIANNKIYVKRDDSKIETLPLNTTRIVGPGISRKRKTAFKEGELNKYLKVEKSKVTPSTYDKKTKESEKEATKLKKSAEKNLSDTIEMPTKPTKSKLTDVKLAKRLRNIFDKPNVREDADTEYKFKFVKDNLDLVLEHEIDNLFENLIKKKFRKETGIFLDKAGANRPSDITYYPRFSIPEINYYPRPNLTYKDLIKDYNNFVKESEFSSKELEEKRNFEHDVSNVSLLKKGEFKPHSYGLKNFFSILDYAVNGKLRKDLAYVNEIMDKHNIKYDSVFKGVKIPEFKNLSFTRYKNGKVVVKGLTQKHWDEIVRLFRLVSPRNYGDFKG